MGFNKTKASLAAVGCAAMASLAQASITQAPTMPAQVSIKGTGVLFDTFGFQFQALGSARNEGESWIADVTAVGDGLFRLDGEAALKFGVPNSLAHPDDIIWKNFTIDFGPAESFGTPRLWADAYDRSGVKRISQAHFAFLGGVDFTQDGLPEGQSLLWLGGSASLGTFGGFSAAIWKPQVLAEISVSAVPEPAAWQAMGLGLVGLMGVQAARRRQRAAR